MGGNLVLLIVVVVALMRFGLIGVAISPPRGGTIVDAEAPMKDAIGALEVLLFVVREAMDLLCVFKFVGLFGSTQNHPRKGIRTLYKSG